MENSKGENNLASKKSGHGKDIKILLVEDLFTDAELILRALKKGLPDFAFRHLLKPDSLLEELSDFDPDIILSDYSLPGATALDVLQQTKSYKPEIPLIVVTGAIDEETAVDCIKQGASDYVLKNNLIRLVPAVKNALEKRASVLEQKRAEYSLYEKEKQLSLILSTSPVGIINVGAEGEILYVNDRAVEILGMPREELLKQSFTGTEWKWMNFFGMPIDHVGHPFFKAKETLKPVYNFQQAIRKESSSVLYLSVNINPVIDSDNNFSGVIASLQDITSEVEAEKELKEYQQKLKALNAEITLIEEREKRRLAINLHDHFSQLLAISKMRLSELINAKEFSREKGQLSEVREYIEKALANSRKLTYELSPPILYELGLVKALKWHLENQSESYGFEYEFDCQFKKVTISDNAQIILYRVFSELITNIIKHANASKVKVSIQKNDEHLTLKVKDNGKGFEIKKNLTRTASFGLFSIRERIEYLGGTFDINSLQGKGTKIKITVSLK